MTSEAIANAFKEPLKLNNEAKSRIEKHYSDDVVTRARLKMAKLPAKAKLIDNPVSIAPGFFIENVYVLPGIPKILEVMLNDILKNFKSSKKFIKKIITTTLSEGVIGDYLESIQKEFLTLKLEAIHTSKKNQFGVSLVITGDSLKRVENAVKKINAYLKKKTENLGYFNLSATIFLQMYQILFLLFSIDYFLSIHLNNLRIIFQNHLEPTLTVLF